MKRRAIVVGLDGVPADFLGERVAEGTMPALAELLRSGKMVAMSSSVPPVSGVAWASLTTAVGPGRHGIYGFTELKPGTYDLRFPNATSVLVPRVWERLADDGKHSVVLNVPGTYPARAPAGSLLVSGFVSPRLDRSVAPAAEWLAPVEALGYRTDVDGGLDWADAESVAAELLDLTEVRRRLWWQAWEAFDWDLFWGVFTETDRLNHFHYGRRSEPWVAELLDRLYGALDAHLGAVADRLTEEDLLIVVSDHGFTSLRTEVHLNHALEAAGLLGFETEAPQGLDDLGPGSRAFVLDPGRVYVHRQHRYPLGAVVRKDEKRIIAEAKAALEALRDPETGEAACGAVLTAAEAFSGPALADAPDLTVLPRPGLDPKGMIGALARRSGGDKIFGRGVLTGMHTYEGAVCFVRAPDGGLPSTVRLEDVGASVLAHLGGDPASLDGDPVLAGA